MSNVRKIDDYLFRPHPDKQDWFTKIISDYAAAEKRREQKSATFIADCVRHRMETTDSRAVYDQCKAWLGERS